MWTACSTAWWGKTPRPCSAGYACLCLQRSAREPSPLRIGLRSLGGLRHSGGCDAVQTLSRCRLQKITDGVYPHTHHAANAPLKPSVPKRITKLPNYFGTPCPAHLPRIQQKQRPIETDREPKRRPFHADFHVGVSRLARAIASSCSMRSASSNAASRPAGVIR